MRRGVRARRRINEKDELISKSSQASPISFSSLPIRSSCNTLNIVSNCCISSTVCTFGAMSLKMSSTSSCTTGEISSSLPSGASGLHFALISAGFARSMVGCQSDHCPSSSLSSSEKRQEQKSFTRATMARTSFLILSVKIYLLCLSTTTSAPTTRTIAAKAINVN